MDKNQYRNVQQLIDNGDFAAAKLECLKLLDDINSDVNVWWQLGQIQAKLGAYADAEACYQKIVELDPESYAGYCYLGLTRVYQGMPEMALPSLLRAVAINPEFAPGFDYLGCVLRDLGRFVEAITSYGEALRIAPGLISARLNLGNLLSNIGRLEQAMECYDEILHIEAAHPEAIAGKASILEKQGMLTEAFRYARSLVDRGALNHMSAAVFSDLSVEFGCQDEAIAIVTRVLDMPGLAPVEARALLFSLGRLYDHQGSYRHAFDAYKKANSVIPSVFDTAAFADKIDAYIKYFSHARLDALASQNNDSRRPVFIVGMPRSGTSLVEQVIASHPDVYGAGELDDIAELAGRTSSMAAAERPFPFSLDSCTEETIGTLAREYLNHLEKLSPDAIRITDKMPGNYLYLGFIQLLFPHARIIHCVRDPADTCLSCYFQNFGTGHLYSGDLGKLGEVYSCYRKMMKHWESVLTLPVFRVRYEDMVESFESTVRELVDFCDIDWDERCLEFHNTRRVLNTASYDQIRQPIYDYSVQRWRFYAEYLDELLDVLEEENIRI